MDIGRRMGAWLRAGLVCAFLGASLVSCGGDDDDDDNDDVPSPPPAASTYIAATLVSEGAVSGARLDDLLINPWGLAFHPTGFAWVANNGTSTATSYDGNGVIQQQIIRIPPGVSADASPTGIVYNDTQDFRVTQNGVTGASEFIFVGEAGTISGWSQRVNATTSVTVFDGGFNGPVYKGLTAARNAGVNYIYAADFRNNTIEVYNGDFVRASPGGNFRDPGLPSGYAAYGIQAIGDRIYIAHAQQAPGGRDETKGPGLGVISVFTTNGTFIRQLARGGALNAPWGMAIAPVNFGAFSGDLLVANFGDGKINAYDPDTGRFQGTLTRPDGAPIAIDGLWGIAFGNGSFSQPLNTLFFTAGPSDETQGLYGRIDLQ